MAWEDVNFDAKRFACAPFGGPIAAVRDERKMVVVQGGSMDPIVRLFTSSGVQLGSFAWQGGKLALMAWTQEEELLMLQVGLGIVKSAELNLLLSTSWMQDAGLAGKLGER